MKYSDEQRLDYELGPAIENKIEHRGINRNYLVEKLEVSPQVLRESLKNWKEGRIFGVSSATPKNPQKCLDRLASLLEYLEFENNDPHIKRLQERNIGFVYRKKSN